VHCTPYIKAGEDGVLWADFGDGAGEGINATDPGHSPDDAPVVANATAGGLTTHMDVAILQALPTLSTYLLTSCRVPPMPHSIPSLPGTTTLADSVRTLAIQARQFQADPDGQTARKQELAERIETLHGLIQGPEFTTLSRWLDNVRQSIYTLRGHE
jgi:hypothetical protein